MLANSNFLGQIWPKMKKNVYFWPTNTFLSLRTKFWPIYESFKVFLVKSMEMAEKLEFWAAPSSFQIKIFWCFLAKSWPRWFFEVGPQWKNVRNSIWVLLHLKKWIENLFWPRFGQKTSKFQLSNLFYRHGLYHYWSCPKWWNLHLFWNRLNL